MPLDDSEDNRLVREAGALWHELGMRNKINVAGAVVRREVLTPQLRRRSCGETWMELLITNPSITAVAEEFVA